jgi:hypothetical protein
MMGVRTEWIILRRWQLIFDITQVVTAVRRKAAGTIWSNTRIARARKRNWSNDLDLPQKAEDQVQFQ